MTDIRSENCCQRTLPAEWEPQEAILLTWPHKDTDWNYMLDEVEHCFVELAQTILQYQRLIVATPHVEEVKQRIGTGHPFELTVIESPTNDTWARDHGAITVIENGQPIVLDFCFNGWGLKFSADKDNGITRKLVQKKAIQGRYENHLNFILEGGSIESDGKGTILTTKECLLSPNRNGGSSQEEIEQYLKQTLGAKQVLWLDHGYLAGDDTDSHIDTLARLCPDNTIVYVECNDPSDEHFEPLRKMRDQLSTFRTLSGKPFRLIPLPFNRPIIANGERLPASYPNFLILNQAVICPTYRQDDLDQQAIRILATVFPDRKVIAIDAYPLICQHGSIHCITMQFPSLTI